MRAWILSDLHVDSGDQVDLGEHPDCGAILMAGDLSDGTYDPVHWLLSTFSDEERDRLVYVPGNHDFYGLDLEAARERLHKISRSTGIHILDHTTTMIDGQHFVGATLWTDFRVPDRSYGMLGDLHHIPHFTADEWRRRYAEDLAFLQMIVRPGDVVITHHSPSLDGLDPRMQHDPRLMSFASGYATDLEQVIADLQPAMWVHGHTHITRSYEIAGVPIVTNALGRGSGLEFKPDLVVEIGGHRPRLGR